MLDGLGWDEDVNDDSVDDEGVEGALLVEGPVPMLLVEGSGGCEATFEVEDSGRSFEDCSSSSSRLFEAARVVSGGSIGHKLFEGGRGGVMM